MPARSVQERSHITGPKDEHTSHSNLNISPSIAGLRYVQFSVRVVPKVGDQNPSLATKNKSQEVATSKIVAIAPPWSEPVGLRYWYWTGKR